VKEGHKVHHSSRALVPTEWL